MDNIRPRTAKFFTSNKSSSTMTLHRPQRPKKIMKSIWVKKESTVGSQTVLPKIVSVKGSAMINQTWRPKGAYLDSVNRDNGSYTLKQFEYVTPLGVSNMTETRQGCLILEEFKGGYVAFGNDPKGGRITGKGTIKTSCIDFEKVSYVEELKFNLLSVSQICDKKHNATKDEAVLWHRRLGYVNFKNINKLVKGNLSRGSVDYEKFLHRLPEGKQQTLFALHLSWEFTIYQMDFKSACLYGNITEKVYVDDIIFGSTKSSMVKNFEEIMQKEFKMSSMGELTFFLGLQVKQTTAGIFLSQDKYVKDILNKFDFRTIKPTSTPIEAHKSLGKERGERMMFQVTPKVSHIHAVKRIFRYLKHQPKLGLWYPKDSPFHLEAFSDSDYAGDNHDRRSTSGGCQYLGRRLVSWHARNKPLWLISSTEANIKALQVVVSVLDAKSTARLWI
ncbi:putative ribonuclease H-like domain-containing protein [Tanacetum coccineum]|uniref:Ribonuclease H-like domain-containing protein n=1 Tax=Tanacetum coccineum TaxID=301880 RepID=A0ABQ4ZLQ5_9ASTR